MNLALGMVKNSKAESEPVSRKAIARSFGSAAGSYDQHAALQRKVADKLLDLLPASLGNAALVELGCGTGYCTRKLQQLKPQYLLAVDLALPMLERLRQEGGSSVLLCADAESLPLAQACADWVISSLTIQWCANPGKLFAGIAEVLKPGGRAALSTFGPASLQELRAAWAQVDSYTHVNNFATAAQLQLAAEQAGLCCSLHSEILYRHYGSLYELGRELKALGAHNMNRSQAQGLTSPQKFRSAARHFAAASEDATRIAVSWEIYYLLLEKPVDESRSA